MTDIPVATVEAALADSASYEVFDPTNVKFKPDQAFVKCADDGKSTLEIVSPDMALKYPVVSGEGDLGKNTTDNKYGTDDRKLANFKVMLTVGGFDLDDLVRELCPDLVKNQMTFLRKVYETSVNALTQAFEADAEDFATPIAKAYNDALAEAVKKDKYLYEEDVKKFKLLSAEEQEAGTAPKRNFAKTDDVKRALIKDTALAENVAKWQLQFFLEHAVLPPNPDDFDEEGVQMIGEKRKTIGITVKRKVWKNEGEYRKGAMPAMPAFTSRADKTTWPALVDAQAGNYKWQPWRFIYQATGKEAVRPTYKVPGNDTLYQDFSWDPLANFDTLASMRFMFRVWSSGDNYGVTLTPKDTIYIVRQAPKKHKEMPPPRSSLAALPPTQVAMTPAVAEEEPATKKQRIMSADTQPADDDDDGDAGMPADDGE